MRDLRNLDWQRVFRRYWYVVPAMVVFGLFGYLFYLSLSLKLASLWVGFGSFLAYVIGMALFIGGPFLVTKGQPWWLRYGVVFRFYNWLARQAFGRGQTVKREHAGVELCASVFDTDHGSEHVKLDGEWLDFEDTADRMQYLRSGGPFGVLLERSTLMIDPVDSAIGAERKEVVEDGEEVVDLGQFGECVREHVELPAAAPVVDLRDARHLLGGNAEPTDAKATEEFEKKAWYEHQNVPVVDAMVMAGLFSATLFVIWLLFSFKDGGGSTGGANPVKNIASGTLPFILWGLRR